MPYMPSVAFLAAAHKGRIKNIRATSLRETKEERNPGVVILTFESEALAYDKQQTQQLGHSGNNLIIVWEEMDGYGGYTTKVTAHI